MAGSNNDTIYGSNINLSGGVTPSILTNGQLLIGTTALNAGGTHVSVGTISSSNGSLTITNGAGTIDITAASSTTFTPDTGGVISAVSGNIDILGYDDGAISIMDTHKTAAGQMKIESRAWLTPLVVDSSTTVGARGTFSTIAAAIAAAVSGQVVFIRPGTYTENITLKDGVILNSLGGVTILGNTSTSAAGAYTLINIVLTTNGAAALSVTGSAASIVVLSQCAIIGNSDAIVFSSSNAGAIISMSKTTVYNQVAGLKAFAHSSAGTMTLRDCVFTNAGGSTVASTITAGVFNAYNCEFYIPITSSGTSSINVDMCMNLTFGNNQTAFTVGGSGTNQITYTDVQTGTGTAISVGSTLTVSDVAVSSTNAAAIAGAGTLIFGPINFYNTSSAVTTTTQTARKIGPLVNVGAFAGNYVQTAISYQVLRSDYIIGVTNTAAARTITTPASGATTGQMWVIKDESGGAAAFPIIVAAGTGTIDGAASITIPSNYGSVTVYFNGTNYFVV